MIESTNNLQIKSAQTSITTTLLPNRLTTIQIRSRSQHTRHTHPKLKSRSHPSPHTLRQMWAILTVMVVIITAQRIRIVGILLGIITRRIRIRTREIVLGALRLRITSVSRQSKHQSKEYSRRRNNQWFTSQSRDSNPTSRNPTPKPPPADPTTTSTRP